MSTSLSQLNEQIAAIDHGDGDVSLIELPKIYYYAPKKEYYIPDKRGRFVCINQSSVYRHLVCAGFNPVPPKGCHVSEVDVAFGRIQTEQNVDYVGSLAGYPIGLLDDGTRRVLVTDEAKFFAPCAGEWPLLRQILENLFGPEQIVYVYGWLKMALEMFSTKVWQPGQAFCMCGPADSGKNLTRKIFTTLLGGRMQDPWQFMTGGTPFNSELFGAECLAIEDKAESIDIRARRHFGAAIKNITVNQDQRLHRKGEEGVVLNPLWRFFTSLNDEPEHLGVLPPMDADIEDKIMLFLVEKHPMPMPTSTPAEKKLFFAALTAELPAFAHFLLQWKIKDHLVSNRFGIRHYHHPKLLWELENLAPEKHLLDLIDECLRADYSIGRSWSGKAADLRRKLMDHKACADEARRLLVHSNSCGRYLGRLQRLHGDRISSSLRNGHTIWKIRPDPSAYPRRLTSAAVEALEARLQQVHRPTIKIAKVPGGEVE